jgi:hypothetical protein
VKHAHTTRLTPRREGGAGSAETVGVQRMRESIPQEIGGEEEDNHVSRDLIALREERRP